MKEREWVNTETGEVVTILNTDGLYVTLTDQTVPFTKFLTLYTPA